MRDVVQLNKEVGENLRAVRKIARRTQTDLGEVLGITAQQVQKYETGDNRISAASLVVLAHYLGVPPSFLLPRARPKSDLRASDEE